MDGATKTTQLVVSVLRTVAGSEGVGGALRAGLYVLIDRTAPSSSPLTLSK